MHQELNSKSPRRRVWRTALAAALVLAALIAAVTLPGWGRDDALWHEAGRQVSDQLDAAGTEAADPEPVDPLIGHWAGRWISDRMGEGSLDCRIRRVDDNEYLAAFRATYFGGMTHDSEVVLTVSPRANDWVFTGDADLGPLWGVFHYDGHTDGRQFHSTFKSRVDNGTFEMVRLPDDAEIEE